MITNKDIRVENGNLVLNGDKFPLDGQSPETIMEIVEDNSDTTPTENSDAPITSGGVFTANKAISDTIGDITQSGVTGATVAAQLAVLNTSKLTLVEHKETNTGTTLTFNTPIQDKMYLIAMSAPFTATSRQMKCSMIRPVDTTTNEISFGSTSFTVTVNNSELTITNSDILFGIRASLFILE